LGFASTHARSIITFGIVVVVILIGCPSPLDSITTQDLGGRQHTSATMVKVDPSMFPGMDQDDIDNAIANYYYSCNAVSPTCPVQATTLGYYPNRGINIFFAIGFGAAAIVALALGVKKKTWSYTGFVVAGSALELAGG